MRGSPSICSLAAIASAALLLGCGNSGDGQAPATTGPADAGNPPAEASPSAPGQFRSCPSDDPTGFQTKRLVGLKLPAAESTAKAGGCTVRVVRRDGKDLPATADFQASRIDVAVSDNVVRKILGVG